MAIYVEIINDSCRITGYQIKIVEYIGGKLK